MKKILDELKEQLNILKEKIEIVESKIDESKSEIIIIEKEDFKYFEFKYENGDTFIKYKECLFYANLETIKLFKEGKLNVLVIKKLETPSTLNRRYAKLLRTHTMLNELDAAKYVHYNYDY